MVTSKQFAEKLLDIEAVKINLDEPYTWASGWKSPIYCDNRKVLSHAYTRDFVKSELANLVLDHFSDATLIAGVATAGIAHGVLIADLLKLPFVYVRSEPKKHGMGNQIEGAFTPGQKVVVVEDLVSTGGSSLKVVDVLKSQGLEVMGMLALFTYGFPQAQQAFESYNLPLHSISNYEALIELMAEKNNINEAQIAQMQSWRLNPAEWGK